MNIYDSITYFDEPILFDLRLNILDKYVDKFIVIEAKHTHSGQEKKLNFDINNFKKFQDKIIYKVIDNEPVGIAKIDANDDPGIQCGKKRMNSLKRIELSYDTAIHCLKEADSNDVFILNEGEEDEIRYEMIPTGSIGSDIIYDYAKLEKDYFNFLLEEIDAIKRLNFKNLIPVLKTRLRIVVTFMAILEMLRTNQVIVEQDGPFGEIILTGVTA